jgi:hypothetical protein
LAARPFYGPALAPGFFLALRFVVRIIRTISLYGLPDFCLAGFFILLLYPRPLASVLLLIGVLLVHSPLVGVFRVWEYVPLGPFQAKAFGTSISPWVVTREALEPFRVHGPAQESKPLPYLRQVQPNNYDVQLAVDLRTAKMSKPTSICRTNFKSCTGRQCSS